MSQESPPPQYGSVGQPAYGPDYPSEPPPKYEPPNKSGYPPQSGYNGPPPGAYPPAGAYPPGGYQTTQPMPQQTVVIQHVSFGPHPATVKCPYCHATVTTTVTYTAGAFTWLIAGLLCLFGCWLGCCLIPFCVTDLHDAHHACPNCNQKLGLYSRL